MPRKLPKSATAPSIFAGSPTTPTDAASALAPSLSDGLPLPRLVVFDLDYTLWPFWVDTHVTPPLRSAGGAHPAAATDKLGDAYAFYPEVPAVLPALARRGVRVAAASRTHAPELAREMLKIVHVAGRRAADCFDAGLEIYPGSKLRHMDALARRTGVAFGDVLFFDDEARNRDVERLGVTMCLVRDGISWAEIERGIKEWRARKGVS